MPSTSLPPTSGLTRVTSAYAVLPMNATSIAPPMPMAGFDFGRPLANVVISPVCGSTREILPAAPSVTYSAPPGPMVLPVAPSRPVTSRVALAPPDGGEALAADGMTIAIRAAANNRNFRSEPIGPSLSITRASEAQDPEKSRRRDFSFLTPAKAPPRLRRSTRESLGLHDSDP